MLNVSVQSQRREICTMMELTMYCKTLSCFCYVVFSSSLCICIFRNITACYQWKHIVHIIILEKQQYKARLKETGCRRCIQFNWLEWEWVDEIVSCPKFQQNLHISLCSVLKRINRHFYNKKVLFFLEHAIIDKNARFDLSRTMRTRRQLCLPKMHDMLN